MINTILASVALLASTALAGPGSAIVINQCSYDVHMANTPASGGGYNAINQMLSSGGSYSQVYTQLSNSNGWSIKLSKTGDFGSNLLQYEYTYHNDGTIWYDLSEVDGNPWDANWEITATNGCSPRQAAYRFATDDAYGMQSCSDSASITVTLCSGSSGAGSAPPAGKSSPEETWASAPTSEAPTSQAPAVPTSEAQGAPTHSWGGWIVGDKNVGVAKNVAADEDKKKASSPSTMVTSSVKAWNGPAVTVTNMVYETVTEAVTATRGHQHHPRHPHH